MTLDLHMGELIHLDPATLTEAEHGHPCLRCLNEGQHLMLRSVPQW